MIHFDFIVNEADAENIFSAISDKISCYYEKKLKCVVDKNNEHAKILDDLINYYSSLKILMKNKQVKG